MSRPIAFWDTSALVPLCTRQTTSRALHTLYLKHAICVWWGTPVEIASSLARLLRMDLIDNAEVAVAKRIADTLEMSWSVVLPSESLRARASVLVGKFELRAGDALQLSAAFEWCESKPAGRIFLTADDRLREAARLSGFDTSHL